MSVSSLTVVLNALRLTRVPSTPSITRQPLSEALCQRSTS